MRLLRLGLFFALAALAAWPQGGRGRGATQTQQAPPPPAPAAAPGGRGGRGGGGAGDFFNYNTSAAAGQSIPDRPPVETQQKVSINGQALAYITQTGYLPLTNATNGSAEGHLFYTFYSLPASGRARPLVMFFGGAPGVAAAWQEFGGLGPKRMTEASGWADNSNTLLQQADLVFANPIGTAFSRPVQPSGGPSFWTTDGDIASLAAFIRGFLARHGRQTSPLYLAGEDFGTGRVAGLAAYLADRQIPVHGVILLSMNPSDDAVAGDWQHINLLPTMVLTAWHHKKLEPALSNMSLEQIAGEARKFASREYLHALYKGDRMTPDERTKAIANLARLTGLSKGFVTANELRVSLDRFASELLRDRQQTIAYSDGRVNGFSPQAGFGRRGGGGFFAVAVNPIDFRLSRIAPQFQTAYDGYLRKELAYTGNQDAVYYLTGGGVSGFTSTGNDDTSLANAFARNPNLRLFVGMNYFDLASPFAAAEFTIAHLSVAPEVRAKNITVSHLEAGQMPYMDSKALPKLHRDLAAFLEQGVQR
jgi:carboxypeptidase C (cathepsin A)